MLWKHIFVPPNDQSLMLSIGAEVLGLQERNTVYVRALLFDRISYALIWLSETKWNHQADNYVYRADIYDTKVAEKSNSAVYYCLGFVSAGTPSAGSCPCFLIGFSTGLQGREQTLPFRLLSFSYFNILPIRHVVINEYDKASLSTRNKYDIWFVNNVII